MQKESFTQTGINRKKGIDGAKLLDLVEEASKIGIVNISAHGGVSEDVLSDAIESTKFVNQYFEKHPEK